MATVPPSREEVLWGFIDAAGGVRTRCLLQDVVFLAQERGLIDQLFGFPVWPGIGTARYSEDLERALTDLLRSRKVFDTGGVATLTALERAPAAARTAAAELARLLAGHDESTLSLIAAYAMAERGARERGVRDPARVREAAAIRLGWPDSIVATAQRELEGVRKA